MNKLQRLQDLVTLRQQHNHGVRLELCQRLADPTVALDLRFIAAGIQLAAEEPVIMSIQATLASELSAAEKIALVLTEASLNAQETPAAGDQVAAFRAYTWRKIEQLLDEESVIFPV